MRLRPDDSDDLFYFVRWSYVGAGAPWQHTSEWQPPAEPTPTEPDRIAALERRVAELEAAIRCSAEPTYEHAKVEHLRALTTLTLAKAKATLAEHGVTPEGQP